MKQVKKSKDKGQLDLFKEDKLALILTLRIKLAETPTPDIRLIKD